MDSTDKHLSVSQINLFAECERKWSWAYLTELKVSGKSQILGALVHERIASLLRGESIDINEILTLEGNTYWPGKIAHNAVSQILIKYGKKEIEQSFDFIHEGIKFVGVRDLFVTQECILIDHKTSSNPKKWAKTSADLEFDPQGIIYAKSIFLEHKCDYIVFALNYVCTNYKNRSNRANPETIFYKSNIDQLLEERVMPYARCVWELYKQNPNPLDLTPNSSACGQFGGCPYKEHCNLSNAENLRGILMSEEKMSAAERLQQRKQPMNAPKPPAPKPPAPKPPAPKPPAPKPPAPKPPAPKPPAPKPAESEIVEEFSETPIEDPIETPIEAPAEAAVKGKRGRKPGVKMAKKIETTTPLQRMYAECINALQEKYVGYCDALRANTEPSRDDLQGLQDQLWLDD